jgi:myo-inositol-1(or 4)-monophosphatase
MEKPNYSKYTTIAIHAAISAGNYLRGCFRTKIQISNKVGDQNLVTECDIASEKKIISFIREHFPDHAFIAEESGEIKHSKSNVKWIIDPLDGTVNFAHGIPFFAVSIAVEENKQIVSGVVYQPITQELFVAEHQNGAYLNGEKIQVSKNKNLKKALLATGFPYNISDNPSFCIEKFINVLKTGIPVRRLGVASLDLSYVALNCFDAFFEISLAPWDCAAAKLIIEEANGTLTSWDGTSFDIFSYQPILASNGLLHQNLVDLLK